MDAKWEVQWALGLYKGLWGLWVHRFTDVGPKTLNPSTLGPKPYLEVHGTNNLVSNCSYNPIIYRVAVVMRLITPSKPDSDP